MKWIVENIQIVVAIVAALAYYLTRAKRQDADRDERAPMTMSDDEREHAERTRRIQEEIRRKIAERRAATGEVVVAEAPAERIPPHVRPTQVPPVDPFGGSMRRILQEIEERASQRFEPDPAVAERAAEMERQARLSEQLRAMEAERAAAEAARRAAAAAARVRASRPVPVVRDLLRTHLRDPRELRRAVLLREVLGPPVALR